MNTYKAILDTSRSNGVIATITQFDNATLELQIVTNGEIEHAWESPQFELVAIKRDQYAVRESDQAAFTIKDAGEHLVSVDLKEQFLTCRGSTKMQLVVKDGDRLTTSVFYVMIGESLDHTIIESHRDVAVLDDLEAYIQTGREVIYDAQAIVTDLKDEMSEFNASSSEKEAERQASELNRASKELVRIDNEETRVANEQDRVTHEEDRVMNEEERVANEQDRVTNEQNRRLAENTRIAQERARQDAELQRNAIFEENETIRKDGEKKRIANENEREKKFSSWEERETTRLKSEDNRVIQEQVRVANEETRQRQEQTRQNQEDYRQRTYTQFNEAEASRVAKELQRQTAEEKRVVAETNRQNSYADRENERDRQYAESENTRNDAFNQNEANRQSEYTTAERERVESEELRKSRERERETAESQRATTERERVNAEQKRIADFNREIKKSQDAMNQAASNVSGAIDTANSTMESIEQRAEACLPVIEQSSNEIERARVDYIGNQHSSIKKANDANVDWLLGEVNTAHYEGQHIAALDTLEGQAKSAILSGNTGYRDIDTGEFLETFEEGRNLELVSVKMPVLTTVGKNLFDMKNCYASPYGYNQNKGTLEQINDNEYKVIPNQSGTDYGMSIGQNVNLKANIEYSVSFEYGDTNESQFNYFKVHFDDGSAMSIIERGGTGIPNKITFTPTKDINYVWFVNKWNSTKTVVVKNIQIEQGSVATAYEPYKSNILSTPEDVTLRGIGEVQDELNLLTGEVNENIIELTVDSNTNIKGEQFPGGGNPVNTSRYAINIKSTFGINVANRYGLSDKIPYMNTDDDTFHFKIGDYPNYCFIYVPISELETDDWAGFVKWAKNKNFKLLLKRSEKCVKTVDLSDNHVYSYKDVTHYDCSSAEGSLVPTLSIDVPTNLPAVVTRQRATIQELEKENAALKNEIEETANSSVNGDLELMSSQFELDFRLFEIEMNLDMPMMAMMRGVKSMAMTVYQQAKTLILAGKYEREDMEYKLNRYKAAGRITVEEYDELIALMDARELVD